MSKIPTWEEMEQSGEYDDYDSMARQFARNHVKAALETAHRNMQLPKEDLEFILLSYPETNII